MTWDQDSRSDARRVTQLVTCSSPHLIEMIGHATAPGGLAAPYPTQSEWGAIVDAQCGPFVQPYLGYTLDPSGRFHVSAITPLTDSWDPPLSDRDLWCGVVTRWPSGGTAQSDRYFAFPGSVKNQDQTYLFGPGICLGLLSDGRLGDTVDCTGPHGVEITGSVTITAVTRPTTADAWTAAIGARCSQATDGYARGHVPSGIQAGSLPIEPSSWAAGRRTVECTAGRYDATGHLLPETGSIRAR